MQELETSEDLNGRVDFVLLDFRINTGIALREYRADEVLLKDKQKDLINTGFTFSHQISVCEDIFNKPSFSLITVSFPSPKSLSLPEHPWMSCCIM
jgi:hypothetical protein